MLSQLSLLVRLVMLIDHIPLPPELPRRRRGKPRTYSERLILKTLVIRIVRRLYTPSAWLAFLNQDDPVVQRLRHLWQEAGGFPTRRTWEGRLAALTPTAAFV